MLEHALAVGMLVAAVVVAQQPQEPEGVHAVPRFQRATGPSEIFAKRFWRQKDASPHVREGTRHGLAWLVAAQDETGLWQAPAGGDASVAVTSLALLAIMSDGNTLRAGPHKRSVKKCVFWLRELQSDDGAFAATTGPHVLATLAMTECYALSRYRLLIPTAARGLNHMAKLAHPEGGWKANEAANRAACALTLWGVSALRIADEAGLTVPESTVPGVAAWLDTTAARGLPKLGPIGLAPPPERQPELHDEQIVANALTRYWLGMDEPAPPGHAKTLKRAAKRLRSWTEQSGAKLSMLEWLYSSEALFHAGEDADVARIAEALVAAQVEEGEDAGSWAPIGVWGEAGGRAWATALAVLTLQTPTRYTRGLVKGLGDKER